MAKKDTLIGEIVDPNSPRSLKELTTAIKEYKNELGGLQKGTEEYNETLQNLSALQSRVNDINQDVRASTLTLTQSFANANNVLGGVASGFQAFQGIVALTGNNNEALAETFVKLQAAMAISQSITGVTRGISALNIAFRALNTTILANPYLAAAAGLLAIGTALLTFISSTNNAEDAVKKLNDAHDDYIDSLKDSDTKLDHYIKLLRIRRKTELEIVAAQRESTKETIRGITSRIVAIQSEIKTLQIRESAYGNKERIKALQEQNEQLEKEYKKYNDRLDSLEKERELAEERHNEYLIKLQEDYLKQVQRDEERATEQRQKIADAARQKRLAEQERFNQQELAAEQRFNQTLIGINEDTEQRRIDAIQGEERVKVLRELVEVNREFQAEQQDDINNEKLAWQERAKAAEEYRKNRQETAALEKEIADIEETLTKQQIDLQTRLNEVLNPENLTQAEQLERYQQEIAAQLEIAQSTQYSYEERTKAIDNYNKALQNHEKLYTQIMATERKIQQQNLKVTADVFSAASSLLGESTAAGKTAAIASTTIQTYQGAQAAYTSQLIPGDPTSTIRAVAAAAAAIAVGLKNIDGVTKVNTGKGSSTSSSSTSTTTPSYTIPRFQEQLTPVQGVYNTQAEYELQQLNNMRIYVLESDITNAQNNVKVAISEARA